MSVSFATPLGALAGLAGLLPLLGALVAERRGARVRAVLGLPSPARPVRRSTWLGAAALVVLLALAAAQPAVAREGTAVARADAEAYVVVDTSRSMLAARGPEAPTRFARALDVAGRLRASLPEVRVGIASLTDRMLPHLFPTVDRGAFALVLEEGLAVDRPPPRAESLVATDFAALGRLADHNFFSPPAVHRLAVLLTDGESRPFDREALVRRLGGDGVDLLVVRLWSASERIHGRGAVDAERYRPDPGSLGPLAGLARATAGGRVLDETETAGIASAARSALGRGPVVADGTGPRRAPLAPYVLLAAALPLAYLLVGRGGGVKLPSKRLWH